MNEILKSSIEKLNKTLEFTREEMMQVRTGKATVNLLDSIKVDYYGSNMPIKQVATISSPEPRLLVIQPFDKSMFSVIEKAILASDLGLNPQNDGKVIRLPIPMLTSERREELVKVVKRIAEEGKISVRAIRRDANDHLKKSEKDGSVSEDDAKKLIDQIQKETDKHITDIDTLLKQREIDIREG